MTEHHADGSTSVVFSAWQFWTIAAEAAQRATEAKRANPTVTTADTVNAVVVSAASTEAFINELGWDLANVGFRLKNAELTQWQTIGELLERVEEDRASVNAKFLLASRLLPGEVLRRGATPYQDFDILIKMRNDFAHPKIKTAPRYFDDFRRLGWTYNKETDEPKLVGWTNQLQTPQVATWACRAARDVVLHMIGQLEAIPNRVVQTKITMMVRLPWQKSLTDVRVQSET